MVSALSGKSYIQDLRFKSGTTHEHTPVKADCLRSTGKEKTRRDGEASGFTLCVLSRLRKSLLYPRYRFPSVTTEQSYIAITRIANKSYILLKIFFSLPLGEQLLVIMKKITQPKPKTVSTLKRDVIKVSKSGNTTKTQYPAKVGAKGAKSQLTKVVTSYSKKK